MKAWNREQLFISGFHFRLIGEKYVQIIFLPEQGKEKLSIMIDDSNI